MIKILDDIDVDEILKSYYQLEKDIIWTDYGHKGKQTGLQYKIGEDPWRSGVGKSKGHETSYVEINPFFKDTIFHDLIKKYRLFRTRLMWVGPYACYSMHKDTTFRFHIPLITNPECYFVFRKGLIKHLSLGHCYHVDTTQYHTFMNCSDQQRLHLVGIIND
jgi:hypothetical protein